MGYEETGFGDRYEAYWLVSDFQLRFYPAQDVFRDSPCKILVSLQHPEESTLTSFSDSRPDLIQVFQGDDGYEMVRSQALSECTCNFPCSKKSTYLIQPISSPD